jgi:hypothetical protein
LYRCTLPGHKLMDVKNPRLSGEGPFLGCNQHRGKL